MHLDFDELLKRQGSPRKLSLFDLLCQRQEEFFARLPTRKWPIVIDWGFPIGSLPAVQLLKEHGFVVWWFEGDREATRQSFDERGTVSPEAFRVQMDSIEKNWSAIKGVIRGNIIEAVSRGPAHARPEQLYKKMFESD